MVQRGETGYGCHSFYITDVFRNIVIIADIRLLLCLNIVYCAYINMQFVIFTSYEIRGWLSQAMIQLVDDGYHIVRLSGPVIFFSNSNSFYMDMLCIL